MRGLKPAPSEQVLLDIIDDLYAAALDPALMPLALQKLIRACGGFGGRIFEPYRNAFAPKAIVTPNIIEQQRDFLNGEYWRIEPRVKRTVASISVRGGAFEQLSRGAILTDLDLFTPDECNRDDFYQAFLRKYDLRHSTFFWIDLPGRRLVFAADRALREGPFQPQDLQWLQRLRGHLTRSLQISAQLESARQLQHSLMDMLASLEMATLLLDGDGRVSFANRAAEALDGVAFKLRHRRLAAMFPSNQAAVDRLIQCALNAPLDASPLAPVVLKHRDSGKSLLMQALPVSIAAKENQLLLTPARAIVIIADPERRSAADPQDGLRLLGLTSAEARIAFWSGQGFSAAAVGERVGNTEGTVRFTLKKIYQKLSLSRQAELVLLVARLSSLNSAAQHGRRDGAALR